MIYQGYVIIWNKIDRQNDCFVKFDFFYNLEFGFLYKTNNQKKIML